MECEAKYLSRDPFPLLDTDPLFERPARTSTTYYYDEASQDDSLDTQEGIIYLLFLYTYL